ncbi:hypothetical protein BGZ58_008358 [Dissophora ornata]|nr:hypothetical protein BGZ58_008358 [Dissophora ornata]
MNMSDENKSQPQKSQSQSRSLEGNRPALVHSTHSHLETFDQATREQQQQQDQAIEGDSNNYAFSMRPSKNKEQSSGRENALEAEVNSGLQLDRDVQQSRRMADEDRQK